MFGPGELAAARARVEADIRSAYRPSDDDHELVVAFSDATLDLPPRSAIDVQSGHGHGFSLSFLRLGVTEQGAAVEHLDWNRGFGAPAEPGTGRRARVSLDAVKPLLATIAVLPGITLTERRTRPVAQRAPTSGGAITTVHFKGSWMSSNNFFHLVRVIDVSGRIHDEREFAGYAGSDSQLVYLPLRVVASRADELMSGIRSWSAIPTGELRATHFSDAYNRNRELMTRELHWWVMEYSTDALGTFGTDAVLPTVDYLLAHYPAPQPRQTTKLKAVLADPERWLTGSPKLLPDR